MRDHGFGQPFVQTAIRAKMQDGKVRMWNQDFSRWNFAAFCGAARIEHRWAAKMDNFTAELLRGDEAISVEVSWPHCNVKHWRKIMAAEPETIEMLTGDTWRTNEQRVEA